MSFPPNNVSISPTGWFGSILSCTTKDYSSLYDNDQISTDVLAHDVQVNVINKYKEHLRTANENVRLDDLLSGMLMHAPHPNGKRYVAVSLQVAQHKGEEAVVDLAKAWLDNLLLPVLTISKAGITQPTGGRTSRADQTIEPARQTKDFRSQLATRERHTCAITRALDTMRVIFLLGHGEDEKVPQNVLHCHMQGAHIMPFMVNNFPDSSSGVSPELRPAAHTWEMFRCWTQIDPSALTGENINSPANGIFMTADEHFTFRRFWLYFDKEAFPNSPNKYKVQMIWPMMNMSNGQNSADVEFPTFAQSGFDPPNPKFLRIHASFAKVLCLCGAAEYVVKVEHDLVGRSSVLG